MKLIINHSSMQPIYEQIVDQIKGMVMRGELEENTPLPSVRGMAKDLKVSALTVKKAYDVLTEEGLIVTVHGKRKLCGICQSECDAGRKKERSGSRSGDGDPKRQKLWNEQGRVKAAV